MLDVVIAGAGPAGSIAGLLLARAGARVLLVDRETFPREKLCGDTLNPGAVRTLADIGFTGGPLARARPLTGMLITGPAHEVRATYPGGQVGLSILRRDLDAWMLDAALHAGARFESGLIVRAPLIQESRGESRVRGLTLTRRNGGELRLPASLTIGADGRRSVLARAMGLSRHPARPRRWAFGVYARGVTGVTDVGEMHLRRGGYFGVAPVDDETVNMCVVTGPRPEGRTPQEIVRRVIGNDRLMAARTSEAAFVSDVRVLGPLAVDVDAPGRAGLLLAGDAAGFVDPMTGDGLHLAIRSAVLAAQSALRILEHGDVHGETARLARARQAALAPKLRFNRMLRRLVDAPAVLDMAAWTASFAPGFVHRAVRYAGDAV